MRTGVPCNEKRFFLVRIDLQGLPCKPYRVWVYSVAIMSLQLVQQQHLIYTTLMRSISTDVDHVMGQLISTRGGEHNLQILVNKYTCAQLRSVLH